MMDIVCPACGCLQIPIDSEFITIDPRGKCQSPGCDQDIPENWLHLKFINSQATNSEITMTDREKYCANCCEEKQLFYWSNIDTYYCYDCSPPFKKDLPE